MPNTAAGGGVEPLSPRGHLAEREPIGVPAEAIRDHEL
jgi:hypothetical protein